MIIVVADTVRRATAIGQLTAGHRKDFFAASPRSIRNYGATRGIAGVSDILVDDTAWPLDDRTLEILAAHCAPIYHRKPA